MHRTLLLSALTLLLAVVVLLAGAPANAAGADEPAADVGAEAGAPATAALWNDPAANALGPAPPAPRPNLLYMATGPSLALWETEREADPTWLGEERGALVMMRVGYERTVAPRLAAGGAMILDIVSDGPAFQLPGVALAGTLRVDLIEPWLALRFEVFGGYPRGLGVSAAVGLHIPASRDVRVLIESRFEVAAFARGDWFAVWFPTFGAELPF